MNAPARVLLLEVPKLLRDILQHATRHEDDFELETEVEPVVSPDVVILGLTAAEDLTLVPALLARWPCAQVLTVTHTGGDVVAYEFNPRRQALGEMSPAEIFAKLRDTVRRKRELAREASDAPRQERNERFEWIACQERGRPDG